MTSSTYDAVIIGAGLVGLSVGYHLKLKSSRKRVLLIEKEDRVAAHQSGHNSGVLHSGIYYKPGSLKAKNCISGYTALLEFAKQYNIPHQICGKLIIATSEDETHALNKIFERGQMNGLKGLKKIAKEEIHNYEPHASGIAAIYVPQTGIIDYPKVAEKLLYLFTQELGGEAVFGERVINILSQGEQHIIETSSGSYTAKNIISCAGLHSDRIASLTKRASDLRIIPFRGEYYKLKPEREDLVNNLIYPVPDSKFPFLGVHFTRMIRGGIEAGPNAVLAFKREGYKFQDIGLSDIAGTLFWPGFWKIVTKYGKTGAGEIYRSLSKKAFTKALQKLIPEIQEDDLINGGSGVRAQACDREGNLIDDFNILEDGNIIHVRNAPSPAATACLSIGNFISDKIKN
ncbi:L-2-hydroxyglutarate oxidase [Compostibacter hankyongensis]|uniref:L-2-hydroxyglutarate oxidase n=1 Tax=Compostibacter hankyongensis TaxID=1007089 RepID=A0ABP8GB00_9BACT